MTVWHYIGIVLALFFVGGATFPDFVLNLLFGGKKKSVAADLLAGLTREEATERAVNAARAAQVLIELFSTKSPEDQQQLQEALACIYKPDVKPPIPQIPDPQAVQAALQVIAAAIAQQSSRGA